MKMNFFCKVLFSFTLFNAFFLQAQNFQGSAVYERKFVSATSPTIDGIENDIAKNKDLIEAMKVFNQRKRTFLLKFNKNESVYQEEEQLDLPSAPGKGIVIKMISSGFGKTYRNLINKQEIIERDIFNKAFLVTETLIPIDWKLENETKSIGGFNCYKAFAIIPVSEAEEAAYNKRLIAVENQNTLFKDKKPLAQKVTVWYSPEIPINHGPDNLWGLPGLILEVNDGQTITLCSKVVLNSQDKMNISAPTTGVVISQKDFDNLELKKNQEMKDR
jgi:GLPGLI family protein